MCIQKTAIFYIILILGEFSNGTSFHGEDIPPAASINSPPTSNEGELSSANNDSYNTNPSSYWNTYTVARLVSGAVIPIIGLHVLWKPVNYKREYASVENLASNVMRVSKLGIAITTYMILGSVSGSCVPTLDNEYCNSSGILASASPDSNNSTEPINNSTSDKFKLIWNKFTVWGTVVGAVVLTPSIRSIISCLGYTRSGIAPMSYASGMMSRSAIESGGGVYAGSLVATLQSIGAGGVCSLGCIQTVIIMVIGAAIGFGIGYGVKMINDSYNPDSHGKEENKFVIFLIAAGIALFTLLWLVCVCCSCRRSYSYGYERI